MHEKTIFRWKNNTEIFTRLLVYQNMARRASVSNLMTKINIWGRTGDRFNSLDKHPGRENPRPEVQKRQNKPAAAVGGPWPSEPERKTREQLGNPKTVCDPCVNWGRSAQIELPEKARVYRRRRRRRRPWDGAAKKLSPLIYISLFRRGVFSLFHSYPRAGTPDDGALDTFAHSGDPLLLQPLVTLRRWILIWSLCGAALIFWSSSALRSTLNEIILAPIMDASFFFLHCLVSELSKEKPP